jgi:hypothetical protein
MTLVNSFANKEKLPKRASAILLNLLEYQIRTCRKLNEAFVVHRPTLEISAETLYVRAGILDGTPPVASSVPESIMNDERLSNEQKASLLSVYRSFVGITAETGMSEQGNQ